MNQRLRWSPPDVVYTPIDVTSEGLSHRLLEEVDDDGAKRLIRQLLDAMARRKAMEAERVAEEEA